MEQDTESDSIPLVEKDASSNLVEGMLVAEKTSKWDFFVFTIPFFGWAKTLLPSVRDKLTIVVATVYS